MVGPPGNADGPQGFRSREGEEPCVQRMGPDSDELMSMNKRSRSGEVRRLITMAGVSSVGFQGIQLSIRGKI